MAAKLIFLDIDGVLNSIRSAAAFSTPLRGDLDPVAVRLLANLQRSTKAEIVISSTWRKAYELPAIRQYLVRAGWADAPELRHKTPEVSNGFRGEEIALFLDDWKTQFGDPYSYVILDDSSDFYLEGPRAEPFKAKIEYFHEQGKPRTFREKQPLVQTSDAYGLCASHVKIARYILNTLPAQPKGDKKLLRDIKQLIDLEKWANPYHPLSFTSAR